MASTSLLLTISFDMKFSSPISMHVVWGIQVPRKTWTINQKSWNISQSRKQRIRNVDDNSSSRQMIKFWYRCWSICTLIIFFFLTSINLSFFWFFFFGVLDTRRFADWLFLMEHHVARCLKHYILSKRLQLHGIRSMILDLLSSRSRRSRSSCFQHCGCDGGDK